MNKPLRIGIVGYGNLGKSTERCLLQNPDMELAGVFTRRDPDTVTTVTGHEKVYHVDEAITMTGDIDVMVLCGGSMSDIPVQGPAFAALFNTVDGFDTHAKINEYFDAMDGASRKAGTVAVVASGWDPGMFSINRLYAESILPDGETYTFWGKGISQGHSDAIRRVEGVRDAKQYTIPREQAIGAVKNGETPELSVRDKHKRVCYVVAKEGADRPAIEQSIVNMPDYFADYDTEVHFISQEELDRDHGGLPHGGTVIRYGQTGPENSNKHVVQYEIALDSNPDFTACVLLAYARAAYRLRQEGGTGARTVIDIAPAYLSPQSGRELRAALI